MTLGALPTMAQQVFTENVETTMAGDTLEFVRFADKPILVYTAALWHEGAMQYSEILDLQQHYGSLGFVLMELYSADMSNIDYVERQPFYMYNRAEYPPCTFTFPLFVHNDICPFFRFLSLNTTVDNFVTTEKGESYSQSNLVLPLHKWIINRRGEVVKCFDPSVPMLDVIVALKEVLDD